LILDEIPHCLGRTGRMFTCEHYGIVPDMLVIGKGLGGGIFPFAALIARDTLDVMPDRALGHYTHEKNPVACAAALATIEILEDGILDHVRVLGDYTLQRLADLKARHRIVKDVRGLGLFLGVELQEASPQLSAAEAAEQVMYRSLEKGLNFKVTNGTVLTLTPALTIQRAEMDQALDILESAIAECESAA